MDQVLFFVPFRLPAIGSSAVPGSIQVDGRRAAGWVGDEIEGPFGSATVEKDCATLVVFPRVVPGCADEYVAVPVLVHITGSGDRTTIITVFLV